LQQQIVKPTGRKSFQSVPHSGRHLDSRLLVDLSLAKRVLVYLIANAQLYSSPGRPITITTKQNDKFYDISVADQGPGIEEEEIEHIFGKFYRGKNVRYRIQGTGMGLPIAKMIVEAHGGTIRVLNYVGQESVFTFSLPAERDAQKVPRGTRAAS
jgi:signal transduction histidine kinase